VGAAVAGVAIGGAIRGTRTDFLQRLQSNIFVVAPASTTIGAEQCGQLNRISLLAVPISGAPPFCIVLETGAVIIPLKSQSQLGATSEIELDFFAPA
jgi:hypothetical protein